MGLASCVSLLPNRTCNMNHQHLLCFERNWEHPQKPNGASVVRLWAQLWLAPRCFWSQEGEQPLKEKVSFLVLLTNEFKLDQNFE